MATNQGLWEIHIFGNLFSFSPYFLFHGVGLILSLLLLDEKLKKAFITNHNKIYIIYVCSIIAGWIGAHIFDFLFRDIFFKAAGFTFFGGLLSGAFFFIILFIIFSNSEKLLIAINAGVIPLVLGHAIGRLGCFFSGCCYGKLLTQENFLSTFFLRHPTQLYESFFMFMLFIFLNLKHKIIKISDLYIYLFSYGIFRFFIEFLRGDVRAYWNGFSFSQWISLLIITSLILVISVNWIMRHL